MFDYIANKNTNRRAERVNKVLTIGGMIGAGKTTITNLLSKELGYQAFYENVEGNDILPLFYTASDEEKERKRYPFLLQLEFLNSRFDIIKTALRSDNDIIMDRSIYEDWYFARVNTDLGDISEQEFKLYEKLLHNMMQELDELPKKQPDLMVYLKISFEKTIERIGKRGRSFEQDERLIAYYYTLWKDYDEWVYEHYSESDVLVIDMDKVDVEAHPEHADLIVAEVANAYQRVKEKDNPLITH